MRGSVHPAGHKFGRNDSVSPAAIVWPGFAPHKEKARREPGARPEGVPGPPVKLARNCNVRAAATVWPGTARGVPGPPATIGPYTGRHDRSI
jgi:hypothetical protein